MERPPAFPMPVGVFRRIAAPAYDIAVNEQTRAVMDKKGPGDREKLLYSGDIWECGSPA